MLEINLRRSALSEEFDYNFLIHALSGYKNPRVKINDLLKKGWIIRVKKGLYVFGRKLAQGPYSKEVLANLIYGPSYISLEYALFFYGLIPERVETITSITNKRKKIFKTPVGIFSYRYLQPRLFSQGIVTHKLDESRFILIASPEKAIVDIVYFTGGFDHEKQIKDFLFADLRIEPKDLSQLDVKRLKSLTRLYGGKVSLLEKLFRVP